MVAIGVVRDKNKVCLPPRPPRCGDLAGDIEEGGDSSSHRFPGVVDLIQSTCVRGLVLEDSDQFKDSMATTSALGRWSLGVRARRLPYYHQQADSGKGVATTCVDSSL
jgi:hypothetical protein